MQYQLFNPFIVGKPIEYGEPFCDRAKELAALRSLVADSNLVALYAPRRFGKTSLINQLRAILAEEDWDVIEIDMFGASSMQSLAAQIDDRIAAFRPFASKIKRFFADKKLAMNMKLDPHAQAPKVSFGLTNGDPGIPEIELENRIEFIARFPEMSGRHLLAVFDEFQQIAQNSDNKDNLYERLFRTAFQKRSLGFSAIFLGSKPSMLRKIFSDKNRPFYNSVRPLELKSISEAEFIPFVQENFKKSLEIDIPERVPLVVHKSLMGHPFGIQAVMNLFWTQLSASFCRTGFRKVRIDWGNLLAPAFDTFYKQQISNLKATVLDQLTQVQWNVLKGIAVGAGKSPYSRESLDIMGVSPASAQRAISSLFEKGIIVKAGRTGSASYAIPDILTRRCIQFEAGRSLKQYVDEIISPMRP